MDKRRGRPNNELRDAGLSGSFRDGAALHRWHAISEYNKEKSLPMASGSWGGTRVSIARTSLDDNYFVQLAHPRAHVRMGCGGNHPDIPCNSTLVDEPETE
jgi:hypothetical protein